MSFDQSASNYLKSSDHMKGDDLDYIKAWFAGHSFERILDVASGAGHTASMFNAKSVHFCDYSYQMLNVARDAYKGAHLTRADASQLPFASGSFDLVSCRLGLHHFTRPVPFFLEVHRVLKTGGYFVLLDTVVDIEDEPFNRIEIIRDPSHQWIQQVPGVLGFAGKNFRLAHYNLFFKKHDFDEWANRLDPTPDMLERIKEAFLRLSDKMKKELQVVIEDGAIRSYTDKKGLYIFQAI